MELLTLLCSDVDLSDAERKKLEGLVLEFADVFALDDTELGCTDRVLHTINSGDTPPIRQVARRIPFSLRTKVKTMMLDMLTRGIIKPSQSPWSSPIVLLAKKDGDMRFCVDYRRLNAVTKLDAYPLPRIDDALDRLSQTKYFTTLDLASVY